MIHPLTDGDEFKKLRREAWERNSSYWLSQPLRHVVDVGDHIVDRVLELCGSCGAHKPLVVDMGCGSCWLLDALNERQADVRYVGVDNNPEFISTAKLRYESHAEATFILSDLDVPAPVVSDANVVVNAFNFFELADLGQAMMNAASWLASGGTLLMSTIDKTYLILALSRDWDEFHENLRRYQLQRGTQYDFQKIDLGNGLSESLEYPSVLYNTQDFIDAASHSNLVLSNYAEEAFTARAIPKIYCHIEFRSGKI